jgi:hypothetical protein
MNVQEHEAAVKIGHKLGEKKLHLMRQVVAYCGISFSLEVLENTLKVEVRAAPSSTFERPWTMLNVP